MKIKVKEMNREMREDRDDLSFGSDRAFGEYTFDPKQVSLIGIVQESDNLSKLPEAELSVLVVVDGHRLDLTLTRRTYNRLHMAVMNRKDHPTDTPMSVKFALYIADKEEGRTRAEIYNNFRTRMNGDEIREMLDALVNEGTILKHEERNKRGRPTVFFTHE